MSKIRLIICCVLFLCKTTYSQKVDLWFYSLGFVTDYLGRNIIKDHSIEEISFDENLNKTRMHEIYRIDTLLKLHNYHHNNEISYEIVKSNKFPDFYKVISKEYTTTINSYFKFESDTYDRDGNPPLPHESFRVVTD